MPATMYYDQDADLGLLRARRSPSSATAARGTPRRRTSATRAATSWSASGRARPTTTWRSSDGFKPVSAAEAAEAGDLVNILLPDEVQGDVYARDIKPNLQPGNLLLCSHGFNIHFGQVVPPEGRRQRPRRPQGAGPPRPQRVRQGGRRPLPDRHRRRLLARRARPSPWPTPRGSAAPAAASSRRPSPRRPRPTSSASRSSSAAASAPWSRWASRP